MRKTTSSLREATLVTAKVAASLVLLLAMLVGEVKPAEAAFPGQNGNIVFERFRGIWDIYSISPTGGEPIHLTEGANPDVAPSGERIAYVSKATDGEDREIFTIPINGGTPTRLTTNGTDESRPSWSPDGKRIAFEVFDGNDFEIATIPSTGGAPTLLTSDLKHDEAPEWSPDGSKIAYHHRDDTGDYEIAVIPAGGGTPKYLTNEDRGDVNPDWSPNGARLVYQHCDFEGHGDVRAGHNRDDYDDCDIYTLPSSGGSPTELTDTSLSWWEANFGCFGGVSCDSSSETEMYPAYSPDGKKIVFSKWEYAWQGDSESEIYTMPSGGGSYTKLTESPVEYSGLPDWGQVPDNTPPNTTIFGPSDRYINDTTARFWFSSTEANSSFECTFADPEANAMVWSPCTSPVSWPNLKHGLTYTFSVRAIDVAGNADPTPASRTFTVDLRAPTVNDVRPAPRSTATDRTPTIAATLSDDVIDLDSSRIRLYIDGPATGTTDRRQITDFAYDRATDRLTYTPPSGIDLGEQTVTVVATDLANNVATRTWKFQIVR